MSAISDLAGASYCRLRTMGGRTNCRGAEVQMPLSSTEFKPYRI